MSEKNECVERVHALARTQANYVWILLVTGIFYFSISKGTVSLGTSQSSSVIPLLGVPLDTHLILLSSPLVISFLILAFSGAVRAFKHASEAALPKKTSDTWAAEKLDVYPNAIDMVVYHTTKTPRWIVNIVYFSYPAYLTVFLVEAAWLWCVSFSTTSGVMDKSFSVVSVIIWVPACWQVLLGWLRRFQLVRQGKHLKGNG